MSFYGITQNLIHGQLESDVFVLIEWMGRYLDLVMILCPLHLQNYISLKAS